MSLLHEYGNANPGWGTYLASERYLNPNHMVCPTRASVDAMGRLSARTALNTETGGCTPALNRVHAENAVRASATSALGFSAYGLQTGGMCAPPGGVYPSAAARSRAERDLQWSKIAQRIQYYKRLSGCT